MRVMRRSKSCLATSGGGGERGIRKVSSSPDITRRRTGEGRRSVSTSPDSSRKRRVGETRSTNRKHGGEKSSFTKKLKSRERGRSKSPRRNSWREDIKSISSWREDRESRNKEAKVVKRYLSSREHAHQSEKRSRMVPSQEETKHSKVSSSEKAKRTGVEVEGSRSCRKLSSLTDNNQNGATEGREELGLTFEENPLKRKLMGFGIEKREVKSKKTCEYRKVKYFSRVKKVKTLKPSKLSSKCGSDTDSEELDLSISGKDVFPELREDSIGVDAVSREVFVNYRDIDCDGIERKPDKCVGLKINLDNVENKDSFARNFKLVVGVEAKAGDLLERSEPVSVSRQPSLSQTQKADVVNGTVIIEEVDREKSHSSILNEKDVSAMTRSLSLLELKMEVYITRLKELEWEREQLRKDRNWPKLSQ